jgi:hypothetical protein
VALTVGSLFVPKLLPCVDYPEHLALADVARRLLTPGAPEHTLFEVNVFTYYGLVHFVLAALSLAMPIELAGKLLLGGALASTAWSVRKLLVTLGRPPVYAALFVPMLFAFSASWGFLNYVVALALAFAALAEVAAHLRVPARAGWSGARIAITSLLSAMTHPLAMLVLWVFSAALVLEVAGRGMTARTPEALVSTARRAATAFAPTLAGGLWCVAVYGGHYAREPHLTDTRDPVLWPKLARFPFYATDLHADRSDGPIVYGAVAVMVAMVACSFVLDRTRKRRASAASDPSAASAPTHTVVLPFAAMLACYLAMPMIFMGSQLMFPRLVPALVLGALIALPRLDGSGGGVATTLAGASCLAVAWWSALNLNAHFREYRDETDDASRMLDALPTGRRASAVVYSDFTDAFCRGGVLHLAAWYAARKHGDWAFAFARYPYMPVRYIEGRAPDWPAQGWEFAPSQYDARSPYARTYNLLLVKTLEYLDPIQNEATVRANVFGEDAATPRLLAHYGLYWAFDTAGIPGR